MQDDFFLVVIKHKHGPSLGPGCTGTDHATMFKVGPRGWGTTGRSDPLRANKERSCGHCRHLVGLRPSDGDEIIVDSAACQ